MDDLSKEIAKQLEQYANVIEEEIVVASDEVTKEAVNKLKQESPKLTGDYRKGWTRKKEGNGYVVHNKTDYQLTHLLENGHVKRGGGRVGAKVHIRPVEEETINEFEQRIEKVIKS
ncbi:HK97 gp10 family phage protein [Schinkia azotoformans]|uniref:HK97 gp10 family phage protein n=1 Tax=Schinkia azotoformans TaxID=1454 RepID=UPI00058680A7|nr:HK97 gp10 family phage protein [Schinkia azotoformans]MEC1638124.1 HK97 gp10 family phage protein [Schinkia azotoformans]MEC1946442.1 HK97 gp10 family phage protein [Schinkia azotoformans]MED4354073.1 HK97 gp10 family phage protein [Schinkia azotoformans]